MLSNDPTSQIILVEDEADIRELMLLHLKREHYNVTAFDNGADAKAFLSTRTPQLAILDWMLPGVSGLDLCKSIQGRCPVLMVTARTESADIVLGLEMGADDYITKPFEIPVFMARVRALLRRQEALRTAAPPSTLVLGSLIVDTDAHQAKVDDELIALTASEFKILAALATHRGKVMSRDRLIQMVQGSGVAVVDRVIDTHVFSLRKKLGSAADLIETIRGVGYRILP